MIKDFFINKNSKEKSQIKSLEIAKFKHSGIYDSPQYGIKIEIIGEIKAIEINGQNGIELFARAWRGTQQLGFGADGSVEIERFRIFNPPILVDDPNGTIIKEWTELKTGQLKQRKLKEDPLQAIKEVIAHNVTLIGKDNGKIVIGKIGNTTSTFYSAEFSNSPVDGIVGRAGVNETFANIRGAGSGTFSDDASTLSAYFLSHSTSPNYQQMWRIILLFDTSIIGTDVISSAIFSIKPFTLWDEFSPAGSLSLVGSSPASNSTLATGDYVNLDIILQAPAITLASQVVGTYTDFTLNATGLSNIAKTGITKYGLRLEADRINSEPTWSSLSYQGGEFYTVEEAGTTNDPKLVVVHTSPAVTGEEYTIIFE